MRFGAWTVRWGRPIRFARYGLSESTVSTQERRKESSTWLVVGGHQHARTIQVDIRWYSNTAVDLSRSCYIVCRYSNTRGLARSS